MATRGQPHSPRVGRGCAARGEHRGTGASFPRLQSVNRSQIQVRTTSVALRNLPEGGTSMPGNQNHHESMNSVDLSALQWNPRLSRRGFMAAAAAAGAAAYLAACGGQGSANQTQAPKLGTKLEGTVNLYNWQSYINPDNVKAFEQQFSQTVTQDFYDSNEAMLAKLQAG